MRNFGSISKINRRGLLSGVALLPTLFGSVRADMPKPRLPLRSIPGEEGHAERLVEDAVQTYRDDIETRPTPISLQPSGSIKAVTSFQTIENRLITGKITVNGMNGVTIRNCQINHPGDVGIDATELRQFDGPGCQYGRYQRPRPGRRRIR